MKTVRGNLITLAENGMFNVIVHGCNCFCTMGAGIALEIKKRYPEAYAADCSTPSGDEKKLGGYSYAFVTSRRTGRKFFIVNAYTQFSYGRPVRNVDYAAIKTAFDLIARDFQLGVIGYPRIGAGLGKGDWGVISRIIDEALTYNTHTLVEYDPNAKN